MSSRDMPVLGHNEKYYFKNQVIMLYEIYSWRIITLAFFINSIIIFRLNYLNWLVVVLYSRGDKTTGVRTIEECHNGRTSRKRRCKHWTWCCNPLIYRSFNPYLTCYYHSSGRSFRSGKCEENLVCQSNINNYASICFIFTWST